MKIMDTPPEVWNQRMKAELDAFDKKCDDIYIRVDVLMRELKKHVLEHDFLETTSDDDSTTLSLETSLVRQQKMLQQTRDVIIHMAEYCKTVYNS
jgi:hypothetical protein